MFLVKKENNHYSGATSGCNSDLDCSAVAVMPSGVSRRIGALKGVGLMNGCARSIALII